MLRYAFIGFGQYGGRQVDEFLKLKNTEYTGLAINTAVNDLDALVHVPEGNRMRLRGNSFGSGRTPEIGLQAFLDNGPEFVEKAQQISQQSDFIWAIAGLGGGTGTGALEGFLEHGTGLFEQTIGLIVTLPRDDDGAVQKANAMRALQHIQKAIDEKRIGAVIILDNDRFYKEFAESNRPGDWRDHSNVMLAETLHKINQITVATGHSNFDRTDLLRLLSSSGCLAIGNAQIHHFRQEDVWTVISNSINKGFFGSGYRLEEAESYALCFTLNEQGKSIRQSSYEQFFTNHLKSLFPSAVDSFFAYYSNGENKVLSVVSGLGLPERVFAFQEQISKMQQTERTTKRFEFTAAPSVIQSTNPLLRTKAAQPTESNPLLKKQTAVLGDNPLLRRQSAAETPFSTNPLLKRD